jgi:hypothetical protein
LFNPAKDNSSIGEGLVGLATQQLSTVQQLSAYVVVEKLLIQLNVSNKNVEYKCFTLISLNFS